MERDARAVRVLAVCGVNYLGGGEVALLRLFPHLAGPGVALRATIVAPPGGNLAAALGAAGVAVQHLPVGRVRNVGATLEAIARLTRLARSADVLHANDVRAALYCQVASRLSGRPWVWHVRDLLRGAHRFEYAARVARPTRIIAISRAVKAQLLAFGGWDAARVDVVLHGIDAEALAGQADRAAWRAEMNLADGDIAVGIVGRLEGWKGQEDFVRAAARVARHLAHTRFFVVGDVVTDAFTATRLLNERERLERLAAELGLNGRVTFTGYRMDIPSVMAGLDVLVLASHAEPFGLVVLEAMSQGTAVVATASGGPEEVIVPDTTGLLVPPRSPAALAAALELLATDVPRIRALGAAGYARVRRDFTLEREAAQVATVWARAARAGA